METRSHQEAEDRKKVLPNSFQSVALMAHCAHNPTSQDRGKIHPCDIMCPTRLTYVFRLIFVLIKSQIPTLSTLVSWPQVWPLGSLQAGPHVLSAHSLCQATESLPRTCPRLSLIFSTMAISSAIAPRHSSSSYVQQGLKD